MKLAAVVIGRNEGIRLLRSLHTLRLLHPDIPVLYADSASNDGSPERVRSQGIYVHQLDRNRPLNASRARREGADRLLALHPDIEAILFLDGDCELQSGFLDAAVAALESDTRIGAVCGWRRERHPDVSLYNKLHDIEWTSGRVGDIRACGGDAVFRVAALHGAGSWDPSILAGEEPELCGRLRDRGWRIVRLDVPMTAHDAEMTQLSQFLLRERRTGYGALDVLLRAGPEQHPNFATITRRARLWTIGPALLLVIGSLMGASLLGWIGLLAGPVAVLLACGLQAARLTHSFARVGLSISEALAASVLTLLGKWWQLIGQIDLARVRRQTSASSFEFRDPEVS